MATLLRNVLTLAEQVKQIGPGGNLMEIVNVLAEINEVDIDAVYKMANDRFTNLSSKVISLPKVGNRRINRGSPGGVGRTAQHREVIEILEARPFIDTLLLDSEPDGGVQARLEQIKMFVEAMAQTKAEHLFYGDNTADGEQINGLATRYNDAAMSNVYDIGGSTALTSMYIVEWDPARCSLVYPKAVPNGGNVQALGVSEVDNGKQRIVDEEGNAYDALESVIRVAFGWNIVDDRNVARLANIESSLSGTNLITDTKINSLIKALNNLTTRGRRATMYVNNELKTQFDIWALNKLNGCYLVDQVDGRPVTMFWGHPIRMIDQITSSEDRVV